jgi:hypothetical protein
LLTTKPIQRRGRLSVLVRTSLGAAGLVLGCFAASWSMTDGPFGELLPLATALILALVLVARWNFGAFVALLVLVTLNGIPGPDLEEFAVAGSFRVSDVAVAALVVALALRQQAGSAEPGSLLRFARWWGIALASWWLLTLIRSVGDGVPLVKAALFGRDFLYFAILLPLLAGALRNRREIAACLSLLAVGATLHAVGQVAVSAGGVTSPLVDLVVHTELSASFEGTERVFSSMAQVVTAAFPFAIGLALVPPRRSLRLVGVGLATLAGISVLLGLTRATYLALGLALVVICATWVSANGALSRPLRRASAALAAVVVFGLFVSGFRPLTASDALPSEASAVSVRAESSIDELTGRTDNVGYRYDLADEMLTLLDDRWPVGLGFWHPDVRPVSGLPAGSIRNSDTGVLNAVMTIGVIGAALVYVPLITILFATMRRGRDLRPGIRPDQWFFFGASTWILYVMASSATLVTLFSVPGLVLTATVLACVVCLLGGSSDGKVDQLPSLHR